MRRIVTQLLVLLGLCASTGMTCRNAQGQSPSQFDVLEKGIDDIHVALKSGRVTCRGIVEQYLQRIEAYNHQGPALNAVQTVNGRAIAEADRLDAAARASGPAGPLHCIPVLVKDQFATKDMTTTFGSAVFKDFVPQNDATVVARLRAAGAIIIGKATMGEFASGYAGSVSGPIRNAFDPRRHASGSSGGTGAGIAANFATVGIGEDTGGSIRGPAAVGGLVGLRPTLPVVSRYGMMPVKPSQDTAGPIARTAKDAALVMDVIAGYDARDPVTGYAVGHIPASFAANLTGNGLKGVRIGVILQPLSTTTDPTSEDYKNVRAVIEQALRELETLGAQVVGDVVIPDAANRVAKANVGNVFESETAINAYLAQQVNAPVKTLRDILLTGKVLPSRAKELMAVVGHSVDEPAYGQLQRLTESTRQLVLGIMADRQLDALVYASGDHSPVMIAPDVMSNPNEGDSRLGSNRSLAATMAFPAITVPAGFTPNGIPVGLEFMGRPFDDAKLLQYADAYEKATHHHKPPGTTPRLTGAR